ncbi:MAG: ACP S-malonyltransferase [Pseudomonadota bacterium]
MTQTAVVICPGRGTYNKAELGYLARHHSDKVAFVAMLDAYRVARRQTPVSDLDRAERFSAGLFSRGDNASPLIYGCAYADFLSIDRTKIDVVAVTGNSMGWYIALACAGALTEEAGMEVVNTMGTLMQESLIGGQLVYPFIDSQWNTMAGKRDALLALVADINRRSDCRLFVSIELGGMIVFAGNDDGLKALEAELPRNEEGFPMRLTNHAAFHTPLLEPIAQLGKKALRESLFQQPVLPLLDGRGSVWFPDSTEISALYDYTLGNQVTQTYDFTRAVQNAAKEFAPDVFVVLGPGNSLGGAVAQSLIAMGWDGMKSKSDFVERQSQDPVLISMGLDEQRRMATA